MTLTQQIAKQIRDLHFGKNWTWSYMQEHLDDLSWEEAIISYNGANSIALLVHHMNYYLNAVWTRLKEEPNTAKHELSLQPPPIRSQKDWQSLLDKTWKDAEAFAVYIEQLPESKLWELISEEYGDYFRNIEGIVEHNHYHLGQIVLLKKLIRENKM